MLLNEIFRVSEYLQLLPIGLIGILSGALNYFNNPKSSLRHALVVMFTSCFICLCVFAMLETTQLTYLTKVGISASVGYFGIDRAIEIVRNILSFKK
ncbi:phage holin family protein [Helicobacter felis]|uniref:phage holin family protein n=1 Tax=Helicobacter felis TaxID=214 RepID=UPI000CF13A7F|nr:phage holin family protein [Helicobacter felis]